MYWHLSRIQGYAGITNFMGARFVAPTSDATVIREAAKRGLGYLDDGQRRAASRPLAAARQCRCKADLAIDAFRPRSKSIAP